MQGDREALVQGLQEQIAGLSNEERNKVLWDLIVEDQWDRIREWSLWCIDFMDSQGLVNNHETQTSDRKPALGMLVALTKMMAMSADSMARVELQVMSEGSEFGSQVAQEISDVANNLVTDAEALATLHCAYEAVLAGRRRNVHYIDTEGKTEPFTQEEVEKQEEGRQLKGK